MYEKLDFLNDPDDRRKHPRIQSNAFYGVAVNLTPLPPFFGDEIKGTMFDLSAGGMAVHLEDVIPEKTKLNLELTFPDRAVLKSTVRICRVVKHKEQYLIGIEFLDLPDFMKTKINNMTKDFLECEKRIEEQSNNICQPQCRFFDICNKTQKEWLIKNLETELSLKLSH